MSLEATRAVWERSKVRINAKLVLLAIADYADRDGRAYPSQTQLAEKVRMSRRSVQRILDELQDVGELAIEQEGGGRDRAHYRVLLIRGASIPVQGDSELTPQGRQQCLPRGVSSDAAGASNCDRNKEEQSLNSHRTVSERGMQNPPPVFADFSDHDAAAQQGMILFNVRGNAWRKLFLDCIPAAIRSGVEVLDSAEHMHTEYTRYRARGGLKSDWFFLTDLYGKPESEWGLDGAHQGSRNQHSNSAYGRRLAALDELFADAEEVPEGANGDTGKPSGWS